MHHWQGCQTLANAFTRGDPAFQLRPQAFRTLVVKQDVGLIQQAGKYLGRVSITGTLKNPSYSLKTDSRLKPIEKISKKEINDIIKDIFE